ncbi:pilus assembly protein N-terminal domain-containing protein [Vibrio sp. D404a]|uniref:type II and III secretion system protein family protein n=1 Tax=unclassified Vibrio TaxID=2614977 RepID=UPI002554F848|nr:MULTISPECIES: pilus assembly protein N-terminal domain-containing protein [unclassified Vibrio]MDK9737076.1 pilus assembly protein N-terminal domain-containing protein [Vibrio sp. D404a]MDK9798241.1 pilus assembly protein N-terminal domain-containing protein [Vibrio sp. D449a]
MKSLLKALWLVSLCLLWTSKVSGQSDMSLLVDEATTLATKSSIKSVFIANPEVADYQVIGKKQIAVYGINVGTTSLIVFDHDDQVLLSKKIEVERSFKSISRQIKKRFPESTVEISNLDQQVIISGTVSSHKIKDQIYALVGSMLDKKKEQQQFHWTFEDEEWPVDFMTRDKYKGVINNIEVAAVKQVNVKITIAEVSHRVLEEFGVQYFNNSLGEAGVFVNKLSSFSASDIVSIITASNNGSIGQILAEPNLSVISGETASFLVGGELPVVTVIDDKTNVQFKEFGIGLNVMAKVAQDDQIKLSLIPKVSSLDTQYANDAYDLPALKTRRAMTTIQLGDGQSFVLGGLMSSEEKESLNKIPFVGDIPVLGALFRHTQTERNKTELIIVATVSLIKPVTSTEIQLPVMERSSTLGRFFALPDTSSPESKRWAKEIFSTGGFIQ